MRAFIAFAFLGFALSETSEANGQSTLKQVAGGTSGSGLGASVDVAHDVNGDGSLDAIVGAPFDDASGTDSGMVRIFDASLGGGTILTLHGEEVGDHFGWSVAGLGDVNADGFDDVVVGAPDHDGPAGVNAGRVYVFSGKTGGVLYTFDGGGSFDRFGFAVANVGDVNGDGRNDLAVGSPMSNAPGADSGRVRVYSGGTGVLFPGGTLNGVTAGDRFGSAIASIGDANIDGRPDFVVGAPFHSNGLAIEQGRATLYSGINFAPLMTYTGLAGSHFGTSIAGLGFFSGVPLVAIGAPATSSGRVLVISALSGVEVSTLSGAANGEQFGTAVAYAGLSTSLPLEPLVAVGAPLAGVTDEGTVRIVRSVNGTVIGLFAGVDAGAHSGASVAFMGPLGGFAGNGLVAGAPAAYGGRARVFSVGGIGHANVVGPLYGDALGTSVAGVGDLDGDGNGDWVVGAPKLDGALKNCGGASVWFGATAKPPLLIPGFQIDASFGAVVAGAGDVNHDGTPDVIVGAPKYDNVNLVDAGGAFVYSGVNGAIIRSIRGEGIGDALGSAVAGVGDLNGDGFAETLVGVPMHNGAGADSGQARVFNGATGLSLFPYFEGDAANDRLGASAAGVGDVNLDGVPDFAVGAPGHSFLLSTGLVRVFSGINGTPLLNLSGGFTTGLGTSVAAAGDVNGDGVPDVVAGGPGTDLVATDAGTAMVFSGVNGQVIASELGASLFDQLGAAVAGLGDVNKDGFGDWAAGATQLFLFGPTAGYVNVYAGSDGALLYTLAGSAAADGYGSSVARVDDANGDGAAELLVGAPFEDPSSGPQAGVARLISIAPQRLTNYGTGTPGCSGPEGIYGNLTPTVGNAAFKLTTQHSPSSSLSLAIVCDAPQFTGFDTFGLGVLMHVNLFAATQIYTFNVPTDAFGHGSAPMPIPNNPALANVHFYAQILSSWSNGPCVPSIFGLSTSPGLDIWFQ